MSLMMIALQNINLRVFRIGAHDQNVHAEHDIQIIMYMARTFMLHISLHWSQYGIDDLALWSFAVKNATWLYYQIPSIELLVLIIKIFSDLMSGASK